MRKAMEELIAGRTSIIVTQRLSTLREADQIIMLKKGQIVDVGTHDELLGRCSEYQFMCQYLPKANGDVNLLDSDRKQGEGPSNGGVQ